MQLNALHINVEQCSLNSSGNFAVETMGKLGTFKRVRVLKGTSFHHCRLNHHDVCLVTRQMCLFVDGISEIYLGHAQQTLAMRLILGIE